MGLPHSDAAIDEERVVLVARTSRDGARCGVGEPYYYLL
jgi:hypothetical protein